MTSRSNEQRKIMPVECGDNLSFECAHIFQIDSQIPICSEVTMNHVVWTFVEQNGNRIERIEDILEAPKIAYLPDFPQNLWVFMYILNEKICDPEKIGDLTLRRRPVHR